MTLYAGNITNMYDTVPRYDCGIARSHHVVPNELSTEGSYANFHGKNTTL